jgi:hypothetical protein
MKRSILFYLLILGFGSILHAQVKVIKPVRTSTKNSNFGFGVGVIRSVVYLARNVNDNNDARGLNTIMTYDEGNLLRFSLEYSFFKTLTIAPTWYDIKARSIEANVYVIARTKEKKVFFYPFAGLSYNMFKGYFTGINDYTNLRAKFEKNTTVVTNWIGINAGVGFDYNFKNWSLYFNNKWRVGKAEGYEQYNILDLCFTAGARINVPGTTLGKIFRGTRSRYMLKPKTSRN